MGWFKSKTKKDVQMAHVLCASSISSRRLTVILNGSGERINY